MTGVKLSDVAEGKSNVKALGTSLVAGAVAGAIAKTAIAPLDRTKINFQGPARGYNIPLLTCCLTWFLIPTVILEQPSMASSRVYFTVCNQKYSTRAAFKFLLKSYKNEGVLSLWRGNSATMARIIPYAAIQFSSHEQYKRLLQVESSKKKRFLAGSLAGVTSQTLTYPLDLARARMAVAPKGTYKSLLEVFVSVWKSEGTYGFYRGYIPTILGVIPYAGVSFYTYGTLKNWFTYTYGETNAVTNLICGAAAGMLGQTSSYPLDIVRRRMQVSVLTGRKYNKVFETLVKVYRDEGIMGVYKGLSMNWVKGPIAVGISFATYEQINGSLQRLL